MRVGERYVLGRLIGEGATARVYEAEDTVLAREVAVKVFRYEDLGDTSSERIDEEVRILASLAHPHLLPAYDAGRDADARRFIVMPLVRGTTLARRLVRGPVEPREVKGIGSALAEALSYIHLRGIVHRDVKPSNVLLAEGGGPYLADFGFAHADDGPALTSADCVVGTAGYLAPEQAEGYPVTPAADVYALGLVLLEALTGDRAYRGTPLERATANALRPPGIPARLGPGWLGVLRAMTARDPALRPSALEVSALITRAEDELPGVDAHGGTMELPAPELWAGASVTPGPDRSAASHTGHRDVRAADAGRQNAHHRPMTFVLAALAAAIVTVGVGADWLASGTSARTRIPQPATPGAGATGPRQATAPAMAPQTTIDPGKGAVPASLPRATAGQGTPAPPVAPGCQAGGGPGKKGHGKSRCGPGGAPR